MASHFQEIHSISLGRICMMMLSNGNISRVTGLCVENSQVTSEFPLQSPVT